MKSNSISKANKIIREYLEEDLNSGHIKTSLLNNDGKLDDDMFWALFYEIGENIAWFLDDRYVALQKRLAVEKRNTDAEKSNPHYKVYWKSNRKFQFEYIEIDVCKSFADAVLIMQSKCTHNGSDQFKIVMIKNGKEVKTTIIN